MLAYKIVTSHIDIHAMVTFMHVGRKSAITLLGNYAYYNLMTMYFTLIISCRTFKKRLNYQKVSLISEN